MIDGIFGDSISKACRIILIFFFICVEAEELYNHVAEIFNIWSKSQYFLKEEQNFISANEIDNMVSKSS